MAWQLVVSQMLALVVTDVSVTGADNATRAADASAVRTCTFLSFCPDHVADNVFILIFLGFAWRMEKNTA